MHFESSGRDASPSTSGSEPQAIRSVILITATTLPSLNACSFVLFAQVQTWFLFSEPEHDISDLRLWQYGLGRGRPVLAPPTGAARTFELTLSGGMMGSDVWTINRKVYPNTDPLRFKKGDRARVVMRNTSMEAHPMHLHGQSFALVGANGTRYPEPIVKDVVGVEPHMGSTV